MVNSQFKCGEVNNSPYLVKNVAQTRFTRSSDKYILNFTCLKLKILNDLL